jgi:hypothetical protein
MVKCSNTNQPAPMFFMSYNSYQVYIEVWTTIQLFECISKSLADAQNWISPRPRFITWQIYIINTTLAESLISSQVFTESTIVWYRSSMMGLPSRLRFKVVSFMTENCHIWFWGQAPSADPYLTSWYIYFLNYYFDLRIMDVGSRLKAFSL